MSLITDLVLYVGSDRDRGLTALQAWCEENDTDRHQTFGKLNADQAAGGVKVFTDEVYAMAGNHFPWYDLAAAFKSFPWDYPAVLVISPEGGDMQVVMADAELWDSGSPSL